jgi:hypothetical protein
MLHKMFYEDLAASYLAEGTDGIRPVIFKIEAMNEKCD